MVSTQVQSQRSDALEAIRKWKNVWRAATFGSDEEYRAEMWRNEPNVNDFLDIFGPEMVRLGKYVRKFQEQALA